MYTVLSEIINVFRNFEEKKKKTGTFSEGGGGGGGGKNFTIHVGFMYIAPSSDHLLLTVIPPFKVILRRFEVVF